MTTIDPEATAAELVRDWLAEHGAIEVESTDETLRELLDRYESVRDDLVLRVALALRSHPETG